jgi:hypothetical protein
VSPAHMCRAHRCWIFRDHVMLKSTLLYFFLSSSNSLWCTHHLPSFCTLKSVCTFHSSFPLPPLFNLVVTHARPPPHHCCSISDQNPPEKQRRSPRNPRPGTSRAANVVTSYGRPRSARPAIMSGAGCSSVPSVLTGNIG